MSVKKIVGKIHLWLGLATGLVVIFLALTGCMLAFQKEIESLQPYRYVNERQLQYLLPSQLKAIGEKELPGKFLHSIGYGKKDRAAQLLYYHTDPGYFYIVYIDPYTGEVLKAKNMDRDFFRIVINGHYYLWLPPQIGQPIVASATLIFFLMIISGIILWWPRNKAACKQRFSIRWNAKWKRRNYDLHNVLGFYMSWIAIFIAITGLVMGFQWFANAIYWTTSGGRQAVPYYEAASSKPLVTTSDLTPVDAVWKQMLNAYPAAEVIEAHFPASDSTAIEVAVNPDEGTYWKTDYHYFDQRSLKEIEVKHQYGRFNKATVADKIARMNYDVHVGAIGGLPTKILVFCVSLVAGSQPVTGFLIWRGRRRKNS